MSVERVSYRPQDAQGRSLRARSVLLEDPAEVDLLGARCLRAQEVDSEGVLTGRLHLLQLELVVSRTPMTVDRVYGWLVPVGTESQL